MDNWYLNSCPVTHENVPDNHQKYKSNNQIKVKIMLSQLKLYATLVFSFQVIGTNGYIFIDRLAVENVLPSHLL